MTAYKKILSFILSQPQVETNTIFDLIWRKLEDEYASRRYTSMDSLKQQLNIKKEKGTLFEVFCVDLIKAGVLLKNLKIVEVYKFSDLSDDLKIELGITTASGKPTNKDMGIDIFARCESGDWVAIQCKYIQKPTTQKFTPTGRKVPWLVSCASLSSFYDICSRTGPKAKNNSWLYNVVITNCMGVRRRAKKGEKDLSICHGTFASLPRDVWYNLCDYKANKLSEEKESPETIESSTKSITELKELPATKKEGLSVQITDKGEKLVKSLKGSSKRSQKAKINTLSNGMINSVDDLKEARNAFLDRLVKPYKE